MPWDDELCLELIKLEKIPVLLGSKFYENLIDHFLATENFGLGSNWAKILENLVDQLEISGNLVEAGSFLLRFQGFHPMFCTHNAALAAIKRKNELKFK